jgi:hypothetical protein
MGIAREKKELVAVAIITGRLGPNVCDYTFLSCLVIYLDICLKMERHEPLFRYMG